MSEKCHDDAIKKKENLTRNSFFARMAKVDISGIERIVLLRHLWENARPAAFFKHSGLPTPGWSDENYTNQVVYGGYVDYYNGRCIKAYIFADSDEVDPEHYDREYGEGSFQRIVNEIRDQ
jgi:hypothetical protein